MKFSWVRGSTRLSTETCKFGNCGLRFPTLPSCTGVASAPALAGVFVSFDSICVNQLNPCYLWSGLLTASAPDLSMPKTASQVIVDHPGGLHEGVADGGPDKVEATAFQILAHRDGFGGLCRNILAVPPLVRDRTPADKLPNIIGKTLELFLHLEKGLRVAYGGFDLQPIAHDARVLQQFGNSIRRVTRNLGCVKATECFAIRFTFGQDGGPTQAGLGAFQYEELEKH